MSLVYGGSPGTRLRNHIESGIIDIFQGLNRKRISMIGMPSTPPVSTFLIPFSIKERIATVKCMFMFFINAAQVISVY